MIIDTAHDAQIPALRSLWKEAFSDSDAFLDTFFRTAFHPERCRVAYQGKQIAAALYWFRCSYDGAPLAYLYAVATARKYQRQGICHKLMEHTHAYLQALGYQGTILVPGNENLFRLYETMGYRPGGSLRSFACTAAAAPVPLSPIDRNTFAKLRRSLLPEKSVIQEQENLAFLQTQAGFFAGDGFLLTARKKGDTLQGIELLGEPAAAPGILTALRCTKGTFRTPGTDIPFAMSYSFDADKPVAPSYFGFAFD